MKEAIEKNLGLLNRFFKEILAKEFLFQCRNNMVRFWLIYVDKLF